MSDEDLVQSIIETGAKMALLGLVVGKEGNISVRCSGGFLITASGSFLGRLSEDDVVPVLEGKQGSSRAASTETEVHAGIYRDNPGVNAVVHAHPVHLIAASMTRFGPEKPVLMENKEDIWFAFLGPHPPGSPGLVRAVRQGVEQGHNVVIARAHGAFAVGETLEEAFWRMVRAEKEFKVRALSRLLG